jgi:hypothetical protein
MPSDQKNLVVLLLPLVYVYINIYRLMIYINMTYMLVYIHVYI